MRSFGVLSLALTCTLLLASVARGQSASASITVGGRVSETVFVSVAPAAQLSGDQQQLTYTQLDSHTIRLSLHTSGSALTRVSIPLQLRSNTGYTLNASARMSGASVRGLCVMGARATGELVSAGAVEALDAAACETATPAVRARDVKLKALPQSFPHTLLQGPRISLAGTLDTLSNALGVTVLLEIEPHADQQGGSVELILSASPGGVVPASTSEARRR